MEFLEQHPCYGAGTPPSWDKAVDKQ